MKKICYSALAGCLFLMLATCPIQAQTPTETLEKAVEEYNSTKEMVNGFNAKTLTGEQVEAVRKRMEKGISMLEKVISEGNVEQIKVARYFKNNFKYQHIFVLGMKGENFKAYDLYKEMERDFGSFSQSDFPLRYSYFGKNYVINWENFAPTQAEYWVGYGEVAYNTSKLDEAQRILKKGLTHPNLSNWLKYIAYNKLLDIDKKDPAKNSPTERRDLALQSIKMYDALDDSEREIVKENNYPTVLRASEILLNLTRQDLSEPALAAYAEGAQIAGKHKTDSENILEIYEACYRKNYKGSDAFHSAALAYAKGMSNVNKTRSKTVGLAALDAKLAAVGTTQCEEFPGLAEEYRFFGNTLKANELATRKTNCEAARAAEQKRQEEQRRKEEEAARRRARRASRAFNVYLGFDLLPAIATPDKIDLGGHIDFRGRRVAHSFGYSNVKKKRDLFSDNEAWDGRRAFYAFKIFGKDMDDQGGYSGLFFGYADKQFEQMTISAIPIDPTKPTHNAILTPLDRQYELLINSGFQALMKGFGMDFWVGFGGVYHQLSFEEEGYGFDTHTFSGSEFFEKRNKANAIGIRLRLGMSIGLNLGPKRL